jgi:hypothetical protein
MSVVVFKNTLEFAHLFHRTSKITTTEIDGLINRRLRVEVLNPSDHQFFI